MIYVHRKARCVTMIEGVRFFPGMNTISDGEMKKIKVSPRGKKTFQEEIDCGNMALGGSIPSETSTAADPDQTAKERAEKMVMEIKSLSVDKTRVLIKNINDGYILRALLKDEGRVGVTRAVEARQKAIKEQVGADLAPVSVPAPEGDGSEFFSKIDKAGAAAHAGNTAHTVIPALKNKKDTSQETM